jgi:hypothetical protein
MNNLLLLTTLFCPHQKRQVKPRSSREAKPVSYLYGVPKRI